MDRTAAEAAEVVGAARKRLGELSGQDERQLGRQQSADTKGFKGRGALRRLRDALRAVDTVHHEMAELVKLSTEVVGRSMYLCTHRRALNEQVSLRWRASGEAGGHLSWAEAQGLIQNYPRDLRTWYSEANRLVQELNTREKAVRAALRQARAEVAGQQAELNEEGMESLL
jgi:hypothetical protein